MNRLICYLWNHLVDGASVIINNETKLLSIICFRCKKEVSLIPLEENENDR